MEVQSKMRKKRYNLNQIEQEQKNAKQADLIDKKEKYS